jgi:type I restriction enzyme S subunit
MTSRPSFTNQQINSVVVNEQEHDPFFVYHLMTTLRDELKANAGGAATPIINKTAFSEIEVRVPTAPKSKKNTSHAFYQPTTNRLKTVSSAFGFWSR